VAEITLTIVGADWEETASAISWDLGLEHRAEEAAETVTWDFSEVAEDHARMLLHDALDRADREHTTLAFPDERAIVS
jgi:hypothetical protein